MMSSIPYSRYLIGPIPWYSFLIVTGVLIAVFLACREERRTSLPKDTVIDLALWLLPGGIIGARISYVLFSWDSFRDDLLSVFRIWEGGIAIYGGIIGGLIVLLLFCRARRLPPLQLCDIIVPGLAIAQCIGRWGNWFNIEAYGLTVTRPGLCFFPFAVQVPADGFSWHLATFFYESLWDLFIFVFLIAARHRMLRYQGDVFFFYVFLYAAGRLIIEELRLDSLYASSGVRISQLLSVLLCLAVLFRYLIRFRNQGVHSARLRLIVIPLSLMISVFALLYTVSGSFLASWTPFRIILFLSGYSFLMIVCFFITYFSSIHREVPDADHKA